MRLVPPPVPACVTVKVWPAMVIVPVREPLLPEVIVMKEALLAAVQAQPALVVTLTLPVPPPEGWLELVGLIEKVQVPPQSDGTFVAAVCVVPSLPTAETPIP